MLEKHVDLIIGMNTITFDSSFLNYFFVAVKAVDVIAMEYVVNKRSLVQVQITYFLSTI